MTPNLIDTLRARGSTIRVGDGTCLFRPGDDSRAFLIVIRGAVRVEQTNPEGRTVVLYRVHEGESCILTTACLVAREPYAGYGYAEGEVEAVAVDADVFRRLFDEDPDFRNEVFEGFIHRVGELTDVIDALLLPRTDTRLAAWLAARGPGICEMTQMDIAQELGTAREVVSRTLKIFERRGWLTVGRGRLTIRDAAALERFARNAAM